jgi:hypothetical protein
MDRKYPGSAPPLSLTSLGFPSQLEAVLAVREAAAKAAKEHVFAIEELPQVAALACLRLLPQWLKDGTLTKLGPGQYRFTTEGLPVRTDADLAQDLRETIASLTGPDAGANREDVVRLLAEHGHNVNVVEKLIDRWLASGILDSPAPGYIRLTEKGAG